MHPVPSLCLVYFYGCLRGYIQLWQSEASGQAITTLYRRDGHLVVTAFRFVTKWSWLIFTLGKYFSKTAHLLLGFVYLIHYYERSESSHFSVSGRELWWRSGMRSSQVILVHPGCLAQDWACCWGVTEGSVLELLTSQPPLKAAQSSFWKPQILIYRRSPRSTYYPSIFSSSPESCTSVTDKVFLSEFPLELFFHLRITLYVMNQNQGIPNWTCPL